MSQLQILLLAILLGTQALGGAKAHTHGEELFAIYFRSDNCPNCLILDPELEHAQERTANLAIQHITLDISASEAQYNSAMFAMLDRGLVDLLNSYLGLTGVVFLIDPATALPINCLTRQQDADALIASLNEALRQARDPDTVTDGGAIGAECPRPVRVT